MGLIGTISGLWNHPLGGRDRLATFSRFLRWQVGSRVLGEPVVHGWIGDSRLVVRRGETGLTGNIYCGLLEFAEMSFVLHYLRSTDLFVDVGANSGAYTILASKVAGSACIAFEPVPLAFQRLTDNVRLNGTGDRVSCRNAALGASAGTCRVTASLDTINHVSIDPGQDPDCVEVSLSTLDAELGTLNPTLLKIDVEGYESEVIRGAQVVLSNRELRCVVLELNGSGTRYGVDDGSILATMIAHGFRPHRYDPFAREIVPVEAPEFGGNVLFLRGLDHVRERLASARAFAVLGMSI